MDRLRPQGPMPRPIYSTNLSSSMPLTRAVMHKLQFAKGIGQREMLRANTLPSITRARVGCFARLRIYEENARFILITILVLLYLGLGAMIFNYLEHDNELKERTEFAETIEKYRRKYCSKMKRMEDSEDQPCDIDLLVEIVSEATSNGLTNNRPRFDLFGALFFSGTVISTIGFGSSTPRTSAGRLVTILYGVVGCTCCVLFFNLFLERFITALSYFLRNLHERKIKRRSAMSSKDSKPVTLLINNEDFESASSCEGVQDNWRPSVYKVFFCLVSISVMLITTAACLYSHIEQWPYIDSLYFCFISFATIGFGDYVSNIQDHTEAHEWYRVVNFILLTMGACCFYCLSNVSSIVVRQLLNWMIKKMDVKVEGGFCCFRKKKRYMGLGLRPPRGYDCTSSRCSVDYTDGLLSLKEFLMNNQSSVLLLQKQLIQSASKNTRDNEPQKISATRVGPMGILDEAFGDE